MGSLVAGAAVASPVGGTSEPTYGPAPAPLDGPELPSFRYPLGSLPTKTFNGGTAKEANVGRQPRSPALDQFQRAAERVCQVPQARGGDAGIEVRPGAGLSELAELRLCLVGELAREILGADAG